MSKLFELEVMADQSVHAFRSLIPTIDLTRKEIIHCPVQDLSVGEFVDLSNTYGEGAYGLVTDVTGDHLLDNALYKITMDLYPRWPGLGSLSSGTMRHEDLIPAFLSAVEALDPLEYRQMELDFADIWDSLINEDWETIEDTEDGQDTLSWLLHETLFNALNDLAIPNTYFGSHPGDGADYGFWFDVESLEERYRFKEDDLIVIEADVDVTLDRLVDILFTLLHWTGQIVFVQGIEESEWLPGHYSIDEVNSMIDVDNGRIIGAWQF